MIPMIISLLWCCLCQSGHDTDSKEEIATDHETPVSTFSDDDTDLDPDYVPSEDVNESLSVLKM